MMSNNCQPNLLCKYNTCVECDNIRNELREVDKPTAKKLYNPDYSKLHGCYTIYFATGEKLGLGLTLLAKPIHYRSWWTEIKDERGLDICHQFPDATVYFVRSDVLEKEVLNVYS